MYKSHSPWSKTPIINNKVLDIQRKRFIINDPLDEEVVIPQQYDRRPDRYSFEKYGTAKYWWIFSQRNPDTIQDPINDFKAGTVIRVPQKKNIERMG